MSKLIILKEYEFLYTGEDPGDDRAVGQDTFEALEKFVLQNGESAQYLKLSHRREYGKILQAQNYVGILQTKDGTTIEILPKVREANNKESKEILIRMLKTLRNSPFKHFNHAHLKQIEKMPLFEIFIGMFLEELAILVQKGIRSDYILKEENLRFLKGKLKIGKQIKYNSVHKERFFVQYEEFSPNRVENRLIKTTLQYLYKKSRSNRNQQRIREFLFVFDEIIPSKNIKVDFSRIRQNRQMRHYEQVLLWCRTFLLHKSFTPYKGNEIAFALLFDMNKLFESYVFDYLRRKGGFENITAQDSGYHLVYLNGKDAKFRLKPDIVINKSSDEKKTVIIDTKWKLLSEEKSHQGISQADMYQMFAYGTKYENCEEMYLIYPRDTVENGEWYKYYREGDKNLKVSVLFFDMQDKKTDAVAWNDLYAFERIKGSSNEPQ